MSTSRWAKRAAPSFAHNCTGITIMKKTSALLAVLLAIGSSWAYAHSGRTDKNGCHHDHQTGTYHCH